MQDALNRASEVLPLLVFAQTRAYSVYLYVQGRTTITVAHRLSTIKDADCIFVIGDGKVVESGTHHDLLQDPNGAYARLVNVQALREQQEHEEFVADAAALTGDTAAEEPENSKGETAHAATVPQVEATGTWIELTRRDTIGSKSISSEVLKAAQLARDDEPLEYSATHLIKRIATINKDSMWIYFIGTIAAISTVFDN